jgi:hypothetical protein
MTAQILQVGSKVIQVDEVLPLLNRYQLTSQVLRGMVIDQAITDISCTLEEKLAVIAQLSSYHFSRAFKQSSGFSKQCLFQ